MKASNQRNGTVLKDVRVTTENPNLHRNHKYELDAKCTLFVSKNSISFYNELNNKLFAIHKPISIKNSTRFSFSHLWGGDQYIIFSTILLAVLPVFFLIEASFDTDTIALWVASLVVTSCGLAMLYNYGKQTWTQLDGHDSSGNAIQLFITKADYYLLSEGRSIFLSKKKPLHEKLSAILQPSENDENPIPESFADPAR